MCNHIIDSFKKTPKPLKPKAMKKIITIAILFLSCILQNINAQVPIKPTFYGQNYWFTNNSLNGISLNQADFPTSVWSHIIASGAKMVRIGGAGYNTGTEKPLIAEVLQYVSMVDAVRKQGCEPIVGVPYNGLDVITGAQQAMEIVRMLNVVHKRNVKYFIIANEPGIDYSRYDYGASNPADQSDADFIASYVKAFSTEMKKIDGSIKIIGPELEFKIGDLTSKFFDSNNSAYLGGLIPNTVANGQAANKPFIDFFSYHTYPGYSPTVSTRTEHIEQGYSQASASTYTITGLPANMGIIVDEYNLKTSGNSAFSGAFDNTNGDPNSFIGGQFLVDMMAGMINANVSMSNMWSVQEGSSHGYLHDAGAGVFNRKPSYWHYWMMANYFKGDFYNGASYKTVSGVTTPIVTADGDIYRGVKAYACKSDAYKAIIITNEYTASKNITLSFSGTAGTATGGTINFAFNNLGGTPLGSYPTSIPAKSTYLVFFSCTGSYTGHIELKQSDMTTELASFDLTTPTHRFGTIPNSLIASTNSTTNCLGLNTTDASINLTGTASWFKLPDGTATTNGGNNLAPGLYQVNLAGTCGTSSTVVSIHEQSALVDAGKDQLVCSLSSSTVVIGTTARSGQSYSWSPSGGTVAKPTVTSSQTYTVTSSLSGGSCPLSDNVEVKFISSVSAGNNKTICWGNSVTIGGVITGATSYSWVGPDGFSSTEKNPIVVPTVTSTYTLTVTGGSCAGSAATVTVTVVGGSLGPITINQSLFTAHTNAIYSDLLIYDINGITEGSSDSKTFQFTSNATVNGDFTVPLGATFALLPIVSGSCP